MKTTKTTSEDRAAAVKWLAFEHAWAAHDRRGRWVVIAPGAGYHMPGSPRNVRRAVNGLTPRRARRFSSLSRARAFAHTVNGTVHHWRRVPPRGGVWRRESPWKRAIDALMFACPSGLAPWVVLEQVRAWQARVVDAEADAPPVESTKTYAEDGTSEERAD